MAYFSFTRKMLAGETINVFGEGRLARDFTFTNDIVDGVVRMLDRPPVSGELRLLSVGSANPVGLNDMIALLEQLLGVTAQKLLVGMQKGDVSTYADVTALHDRTGYQPQTRLEEGLERLVAWRRENYQA